MKATTTRINNGTTAINFEPHIKAEVPLKSFPSPVLIDNRAFAVDQKNCFWFDSNEKLKFTNIGNGIWIGPKGYIQVFKVMIGDSQGYVCINSDEWDTFIKDICKIFSKPVERKATESGVCGLIENQYHETMRFDIVYIYNDTDAYEYLDRNREQIKVLNSLDEFEEIFRVQKFLDRKPTRMCNAFL